MSQCFFRRFLSVGVLAAALAAVPAQSQAASSGTSTCASSEAAVFSQPFLSAGDNNWYTLLPGESVNAFNGTGWGLSGGASIQTTTLANSQTGPVLNLPSGSKAVSPTICVTSEYPTARTMVRNVVGAEGVFFYVEYEGTKTWGHPKNTGQIHGSSNAWTLATAVNLQPEKTTGWQPMKITLIPGGGTSRYQIYNLYIDPRMR